MKDGEHDKNDGECGDDDDGTLDGLDCGRHRWYDDVVLHSLFPMWYFVDVYGRWITQDYENRNSKERNVDTYINTTKTVRK